MKKKFFINGYKKLDIVKNQKKFWKTIKELNLYLVEYPINNVIKTKYYLSDFKIRGDNYWTMIVIMNNKYILISNDSI